MKYLDLRLRPPDAMLHPMGRFVRQEDAVRYEEMLTWSVRPEEGVEHALYYVEADLERYREAVAGVETVRECHVAPIDEGSAHVWVREESLPEIRAWRDAFADRNLVVVPPIRFDDDAAMGMTVVGDGADLQAVLADVPDAVEATVEAVGSYDRRDGTLAGALTDRQRDAAGTALRLGYYEVPREADLAAVADALGCAESTASELLRRAEREVFSRLLDRYGTGAGRAGER